MGLHCLVGPPLPLSLSVGCPSHNKSSGRVAVSGGVALKDVPLAEGVIRSEPPGKQNTSANVVRVGDDSIRSANGHRPRRAPSTSPAGDGWESRPRDGIGNTPAASEIPRAPDGSGDCRGFLWWDGLAGFTTYQLPNRGSSIDVITGGVNVARCDGSIRFVSNHVDLPT